MHNWAGYVEKTKTRTESQSVKLAVTLLKLNSILNSADTSHAEIPYATDLGSGSGGDSLYLFQQGFTVTAVDSEPEALRTLEARANQPVLDVTAINSDPETLRPSKEPAQPQPKLTFNRTPMDELVLSKQQDIINASLSIPFVKLSKMHQTWSMIVQGLKFDGVFSGQFFGKRHQWSDDPTMTFHDIGELKNLFRGLFHVVHFSEEQAPAQTAFEGQQYWHEFEIVAVRKVLSPEKTLLVQYDLQKDKTKGEQPKPLSERVDPSSRVGCRL